MSAESNQFGSLPFCLRMGFRPVLETTRFHFEAPSHRCRKRLLASPCLSVRMYQRGSHWTEFLEIWYCWLPWKSFEKVAHVSWRLTYVLLLPAIQIRHKSLLVQHLIFSYRWLWHIAHQCTQSIVALPLQQWLREPATMLHDTHIAYLYFQHETMDKKDWMFRNVMYHSQTDIWGFCVISIHILLRMYKQKGWNCVQ
jgi:hypothetical protein